MGECGPAGALSLRWARGSGAWTQQKEDKLPKLIYPESPLPNDKVILSVVGGVVLPRYAADDMV